MLTSPARPLPALPPVSRAPPLPAPRAARRAQADLLPDASEVFKFMHAHRIGEDCALLYMAWAWVAEVRGNFAFAEKVFARGVARRAEPLARLQLRYSEFQRRMYRKWLDSGAAAAAAAPAASCACEGKWEG